MFDWNVFTACGSSQDCMLVLTQTGILTHDKCAKADPSFKLGNSQQAGYHNHLYARQNSDDDLLNRRCVLPSFYVLIFLNGYMP